MNTTYSDAKKAYDKFIKDSKVFFGFLFDKKQLSSFSDEQKESSAYNSVFLGIKNVELELIKGSVQKYMDFDSNFVPRNSIIEDRWCRIYMAFIDGISLPPVELYKIKDDYFVYDGNHRVSVANYLNFKSIEAEVIEFLPSTDTKENVLYREKFLFEKTTGLEDIIFTETGQYPKIIKDINEYMDHLKKKEGKEIDFLESALLWRDNIFLPCTNILKDNNMLEKFNDRTYADLYVYFLNHKYYESEKKGRDIGYSYAVVDFVNLMKSYSKEDSEAKIELVEEVKKNLKILLEVDKKKYLDAEIVQKNEILKQSTNLEFNHNFIMLFEVDEFILQNGINDFKEGVSRWYNEVFLTRVEEFKRKLSFLPESYSKKGNVFLSNKEKLFFSIQNYAFIYVKRMKHSPSYSEIIANYVLEIYIPLTDILIKESIEESNYIDTFYDIQNKFNYLSEFKKDVTIREAAESFFREDSKKYQKIHDWFLLKFNDTPKSEILIDYVIGRFEEKLKNKEILKRIIDKYGKPKKYGTIFKLEKAKDFYEAEYPEEEWIESKVEQDLEKITGSEEIMRFYKTKSVMEVLKEDFSDVSLIDFYADVLSYADYIGKNPNDLDIIDLVLEYRTK